MPPHQTNKENHKMLKFIKSLFTRTTPACKLPPLEAKGVIARKVSELFIISLVHNGGDCYEIIEMGRYTKTGSSRVRYGEHRARNHFDSVCCMVGAK
ncbi:hypothetical protein [Enterobacter phage vB_ExiM_F5M1E]|nr:hypothetical protein [Enterobacter phage vB_ExiM_F1M1E]UNA03094.1 hypothetical protein [Enterobacter phage vB_ExiM_F2M1E]UNA03415.1 hypothetical protein [Enterobacter phage vB_ExiM_F4M1E]UNA03736.1 hypothetical protein [Enterobacter phage vB_ExiM_F5M1E]UNA04056.1 hypothetical protein [Pantoea phage vB_PdiM_F5M2A]